MRTILVLALLALSLCEEEPIAGGWERRSINENSLEIEEAFKLASQDYTKSNSVEEDDLIRLTVYSQVVSGTNYKITFIDMKAEYPTIQEYVIYRPLPGKNAEAEITAHNEYEATSGLISFNDPTFDKIENALYKALKDTTEKLSYISYVFPVETKETNFFMISAYTDNGEHQYVVCQDKSNSEFYVFNKVK
jgi:hypothetical protein